ncbi:MAG: hypothetical protein RLZZ305_221 [Actinomycetota bacterium]
MPTDPVTHVPAGWHPSLADEVSRPYWRELQEFVEDERQRHLVYPPPEEVFTALESTAYSGVRAVILGQDPYHGEGQAHGLCFSVRRGVPVPPSLRNIHTELRDDLGIAAPSHGNLSAWARRGVLLLNTTLTVRGGEAGSHRGRGWETFTDRVIEAVNERTERTVFVLWGTHARSKKSLVTNPLHTVIESAHPSPLSARHGFLGSRPFSRANAALVEAGLEPMDWSLDG